VPNQIPLMTYSVQRVFLEEQEESSVEGIEDEVFERRHLVKEQEE